MTALPEQFVSLEEYFALEETSEIKHEYYQGRTFAMTGASEQHNLITVAVVSKLNNQLEDKPCRPYSGDFRLKIEAVNIYTYHDLSVICGDTQFADGRKDTFLNPTLLIEVLSDSTEAYDRGKKTGFYRTIPTLREYLLIEQSSPHVERYRRYGHDWILTEYSTMGDEVALDSIGCTLSLGEMYKRVSFNLNA
jgi:Uma2 family endonuclease